MATESNRTSLVRQISFTSKPEDNPTSSQPPPPPPPRRLSNASRKSFRDSLLASLKRSSGMTPTSSRRSSKKVSQYGNSTSESTPNDSNSNIIAPGDEDDSLQSQSFQMIPSLRNSLRSSINGKSKSAHEMHIINEIYKSFQVSDFAYDEDHELFNGVQNYELYIENQALSDNSNLAPNASLDDEDMDDLLLDDEVAIVDDDDVLTGVDANNQDALVDDEDDEQYIYNSVGAVNNVDMIFDKAVVLFDFQAENDNELDLHEGEAIDILYKHGEGWLVAHDPKTLKTGLVPEAYVELLSDEIGGTYVEEEVVQQEEDDQPEIKKDNKNKDEVKEGEKNNSTVENKVSPATEDKVDEKTIDL